MSDISLVTEAAEAAVQRTFARMPQAVIRSGTVVELETGGPNIHDVIVDGDVESIAVHDVTHGAIIAGDRVTVLFAQPHQALIIGLPITDIWHQVGEPGEPAFGANWENIPSAQPLDGDPVTGTDGPLFASFKRHGPWVTLRGQVRRTAGSNLRIFTLPDGHRPRNDLSFMVRTHLFFANENVITVERTGEVSLFINPGTQPDPVPLDAIMFIIK